MRNLLHRIAAVERQVATETVSPARVRQALTESYRDNVVPCSPALRSIVGQFRWFLIQADLATRTISYDDLVSHLSFSPTEVGSTFIRENLTKEEGRA